MTLVEKEYVFEGPTGSATLLDLSAFLRDGDTEFHTYSAFARGLEQIGGTHYYLDMTALGRQEEWEQPAGRATAFGGKAGSPDLRFHDEY